MIQPYQTLIASIVAGLIAFTYNRSKNRFDNESFRREIFLKYNDKYSKINDGLEKLIFFEFETDRDHQLSPHQSKPIEMIWDDLFKSEPTRRPDILDPVYDYLNLCSEEYYWYKKDFVDDDVWRCWKSGMKKWYEYSFFLRNIVLDEIENEASYYNSDFLEQFKN